MPWSSPPLDPPTRPLSRGQLVEDLRRGAFGRRPGPPRVGAEVELLPLDADSGRQLPVSDPDGGVCTLPIVRLHAAISGWREQPGACGPTFLPPEGGVVSYEPGGQIEYGSPPFHSVGRVVEALHAVVLPLRATLRQHGVRLEGVGLDPLGQPGGVPLQLHNERYRRMDEYLAGIGPAGARMMRQTAALQVNVDWTESPSEDWRLLNALAPYLVAIFANSPCYQGFPTGAQSFRSLTWRELDRSRTGLSDGTGDPAEEYADFALRAGAILGRGAGDARPFEEWLGRAATLDDWHTHLTTLFPEVRPKGYAEVRSMDSLDPEWYAAPLVLLAGIFYHPEARWAAADLVAGRDPTLLRRAAAAGLRDALIAARASDLVGIALSGAHALGPSLVEEETLDAAAGFFHRFTLRGRSPADEMLTPAVAALPDSFTDHPMVSAPADLPRPLWRRV